MESGLFVQVITSTEVIAAALFLIFLLPLVFFIASTRSRRRFVRAPVRVKREKPAPKAVKAPEPGEEEEDLDESPDPRRRPRGPALGPEDSK
jgi:hypothetical protein